MPMNPSFTDFPLNKQLLSAIEAAGFVSPTPIQERSINPILAGQQVVGIAQTGTGKTAAFAIPIISRLNYAQGDEPRALILAPTRELALQITEHFMILAQNTDLRILALYGGSGLKAQREALHEGIDILVATPGRLYELYKQGELVLKKVQVFVIDEADKMMDMGFIGAIHQLLEVLPKKKQCLLFSATMTTRVEALYNDFMEFPMLIESSPQSTPAKTVKQLLYPLPNLKTKLNLLLYLLNERGPEKKTIVFCKTKTLANQVFKYLTRKLGDDYVRVIHGNKDQNTRIKSMTDMRDGVVPCLIATDVAARGIDIPEVALVVNFDVPLIAEEYIHRIGRTGRAGLAGEAITFCNPAEEYYFKFIEKLTRQKIPLQLLPDGVHLEVTLYPEQQSLAMEIDLQRKKEDPTFMGAFHEKKGKAANLKTKAAAPVLKGKHAKDAAKTWGKTVVVRKFGPDGKEIRATKKNTPVGGKKAPAGGKTGKFSVATPKRAGKR